MKLYTLMFVSALAVVSNCSASPSDDESGEVDKATTNLTSVSTQYFFSDTIEDQQEKALETIYYAVSKHKLESLSNLSQNEYGELAKVASQLSMDDGKEVDMDHVKAAFKYLYPDDSFNNEPDSSSIIEPSIICSDHEPDPEAPSLVEEIKMVDFKKRDDKEFDISSISIFNQTHEFFNEPVVVTNVSVASCTNAITVESVACSVNGIGGVSVASGPSRPTLLETLTQKRFIVPAVLVVGGLLFKYKISGSSFFSKS